MKKLLGFCLLFCSVCFSCFNPTLEDAALTTVREEDEDEDLYDGSVSHTSFTLDAETGLPADDPQVNGAGKAIATLTVPQEEGPWTPELDADVEDNGLFEIVPLENERTYEIRIKSDGGSLPLGPYKVVVYIRNGAGKVYHRTIAFSVAKTPPPFKKAPQLHPYITTPGRNKLVVAWDELPRGAKGYQLYVGTSADSVEAKPYGEQAATTNPQQTVEITDIEGDEANGYLPDNTTYHVWLKPWNDDGEGAFSPGATRRTSDPIDPYWWADIDWWDSGTDSYEFYFNENNELVLGYCTVGSQVGGANNDAGRWIVRYHISFDPVELNKQVPSTTHGHYTTNEDLTGAPGGVFIVETNRAADPFYAVYYWGHRTTQTASVSRSTPFTQTVSLQGTIHSYLSNAWNSATGAGGGYTATLGEAINSYGSIGNFKFFVAFVAIPWYPVKNGRYKYGTPVP
jgi:hypothetical protein